MKINKMFEMNHINPEQTNYNNQVIVVRADELADDYKSQENQIYFATGGFGCDPKKRGRAVFTYCLGDGEAVRWDRGQIMGVLKDEEIPQYALDKMAELGLVIAADPETTELKMTME